MLRPPALEALRRAELILHAGDVGKPEILSALREIAPVVAVRGNVEFWISPWTGGAAAATRAISSMLYGVQPLDATVFAGVALILLAVASIACLLPSWRASRVDPISALRYE